MNNINGIKYRFKNMFQNLYKNFSSFSTTQIMIFIMIVVLILLIISFIQSRLSLRKSECAALKKVYTDFPAISSVSSKHYEHPLRDYYIKTAYNCCAPGNMKNSFVDLCALKTVIQQGARCLDFEIYSVNNEPVIATSSEDEYTIKESYNSVPFSEAMRTVRDYAFSGTTCPNPNDPLILHFRVKSNNKKIYEDMAKAIYENLEQYSLGKDYSYEYDGKNIGTLPLKTFLGKIIVSVDKSNPMFQNTRLDEYVNIASNSVFMRALRYKDVAYTHDMSELVEYNKKNMTIVLPDLQSNDENPSASLAMKYGCQMVGMSFQNFDNNMEFYDLFFDNDGYAFVLKPESLRYVPTTIEVPEPPPKEYSYKPRVKKTDYYNFTI